ncbi:hypothetical protein ACFLIN_05160 [Corynebacterium kutscheri]|uniref:Secreted protein n=1 Tax=Corynebacterium kutscheri TaxID=35755 RepID=A0A0F6R0B8_9CORY|nr:hypothetical protein [Corynebacterium kutscheri]AKE40338.1 hypothetical protein UL82_00500 [Corynebacterium kutscheri]VEH05404.1 putative secreted protein [Corynebacterium kutscheri]VEH10732.1 putative secreted protein [Corynebacterium kutscheri]
MSKLTSPKNIIKGFSSVLLGVWLYCLVVAPIFTEGSYLNIVSNKASTIGLGWTIITVFIAAVWLSAISIKKDK